MEESVLKRYFMSLMFALAICIVSLIPIRDVPFEDVRFIDKWAHLLMYGALSFTLWLEIWQANHPKGLLCQLLLAFGFPLLLGGLLELCQAYLTTSRSGDWLDFAANATGAALISIIMPVVNVVWKKRRR